MTTMRESMPKTLAKLSARLTARAAQGKSTEIVDLVIGWLDDPDSVGVFMRLTFALDDGDTIVLDTIEPKQLIAAASERRLRVINGGRSDVPRTGGGEG